jgi:hypothetical protein
MRKDLDDMTREELVAEVLDHLRPLIRLTPKQEAAHRAASTPRLRARVLIAREQEGVPAQDRGAVIQRLIDEGRVRYVGSTEMGAHEA